MKDTAVLVQWEAFNELICYYAVVMVFLLFFGMVVRTSAALPTSSSGCRYHGVPLGFVFV